MKTLLVLLLAIPAFGAGWYNDDALGRAHEAYLKGDFARTVVELKEALKSPDPLVVKNGLGLLEKAFETKAGELPSDWKLPIEVRAMKVTMKRHRRPERDDFALKIAGRAAHGAIRQLKVTRFPEEVVLDKATKLGDWEETIDPEEGPEFELDGPRVQEPHAEGLYLIDIETASGKTRGWFILSGMLSSEAPLVEVPAVGQSFSAAMPVMRWHDFRSPEYKPYESRGLWLGIAQMDPPAYEWKLVWDRWEGGPTLTEAQVNKALGKGRYYYYVAYKESRRFGELQLGREAITVTPFFVQ